MFSLLNNAREQYRFCRGEECSYVGYVKRIANFIESQENDPFKVINEHNLNLNSYRTFTNNEDNDRGIDKNTYADDEDIIDLKGLSLFEIKK